MALHDSLGDRMKGYESRNQYFLQRRTPVCIRVDMRAGHTFTRGFVRPFDEVFGNAMVRTMEYCAKNIGNCVFSYCQSDEITFILVDYEKLETDAWFDYRTDKLCSISASMATMAFNTFFKNEVDKFYYNHCSREDPLFEKHYQTYRDAQYKGAMFDARCFNIPKEEVTNLLYWRQLDAERNSIQMMGQAHFSHKELQGLSCKEILTRLELINVDYNALPTYYKRGSCCVRNDKDEWEIDLDIPRFRGEDRQYIDKLIFVGE